MANLFLTFYENYEKNEDILTRDEQDVCDYIRKNGNECFDDVLAAENRFKVFFHLSQMRTSILNWYDFKKDAVVLEIGGEFGALTGMLCQRVKKVVMTENSLEKAKAAALRYSKRENLDVYAGDVCRMEFEEKFDYVIITGAACGRAKNENPLEQLVKFTKTAAKLLKSSGIMLIAVDNPSGSKYQCGYPRPDMQGLNENGSEAMASRKELEEIAKNAGFLKYQFYYPFPDYRLAQEIYSDRRFLQGSTKDRVLNYYVVPGVLEQTEEEFLAERMEQDIREICNSYLMECSMAGELSFVDYAAVSTDRGSEHGFATIICGDTVRKKPLYADGKKSLKECYENIQKIKQHGLFIVEHEMVDDELRMPLFKGEKLVDWLYKMAMEAGEKFVTAIDKLRECIVQSTESYEKNGRIFLKDGYIDMIPLNCFWKDGEYYFFDQEFCVKDCPLDYIMFRALRYTYLTYPELEEYVGLEELKERYGLSRNWPDFMKMEDDFIWDNRQHRVNHSFYAWMRNAKAAEPVAKDCCCGLYVLNGFDAPESDGQNCWCWVTQKEAVIALKNKGDKSKKVHVQFILGPAPGTDKRRIVITDDAGLNMEIVAPQMVDFYAKLEAGAVKYLKLSTEEELIRLNNGDPRNFAFQFLNPVLGVE